MMGKRWSFAALAVALATTSGCSLFQNNSETRVVDPAVREAALRQRVGTPLDPNAEPRETIWDLLTNDSPPNVTIEVNKYIWNAAQQVLDFMPIEAADPFSGVLVYGFGTPPGGGSAYRATVYVQDLALDARSLNVALSTRSGPASPDTVRAIEDALLTRARQLRIADDQL